MRLIRCGDAGHERPGAELEDGTRLDLSSQICDYDGDFFAAGGGWIACAPCSTAEQHGPGFQRAFASVHRWPVHTNSSPSA